MRRRRFFDGLGRAYQTEEERTTSGAGDFQITVLGFDALGRQACRALPQQGAGGVSLDCAAQAPRLVTSFDGLGRRLTVSRALSPGVPPGSADLEIASSYSVSDLDLDGDLELTETLDQIGAPTRRREIGRDPRGDVVAVLEADGGLTRLQRDPKGRIVLVDGPDVTLDGGAGTHPNLLAISYDAVGRRTRLVRGDDPQDLTSGRTWTYAWDPNGNLAKETFERLDTDGVPVSIEYVYDELDRLAYKDAKPFGATPGAEDTVYIYDAGTNAVGRLVSAVAPQPLLPGQLLTTTFSYTLDGNVSTKTRDYGSNLVFQLSTIYDLLDRPLITIYPDNTAVRHTYDGALLDRVARGLFSDDTLIASGLSYHAGGGLESITFGDTGSVVSDYGYDPDTHRLRTARTTVNAQVEQDLGFDWDTAGNLETVTDALGELSQAFSYDAVHRLETATRSGSQVVPGTELLSYGYDPAGNLRSHGPLTLLYGDFAAGPHAVTEVRVGGDTKATYDYDGDGNVAAWVKENLAGADVSVGFARNAENRIHFTAEGAWEKLGFHHYDHDGVRARKQVSGTATIDRLYVDPEYEVDLVAGSHVIYAFAAGRRVAAVERDGVGTATDPGTTETYKFFHPDFVGSNTLVTEPSGWVQRTYPEPFGRIASVHTPTGPVPPDQSATPYLFTDQEEDAELGLQHFGARFYDPWIGRFLSPDPALLGPTPGATFNDLATEPQGLNAYGYVLNRPTVLVDPTGEAALCFGFAPFCTGGVTAHLPGGIHISLGLPGGLGLPIPGGIGLPIPGGFGLPGGFVATAEVPLGVLIARAALEGARIGGLIGGPQGAAVLAGVGVLTVLVVHDIQTGGPLSQAAGALGTAVAGVLQQSGEESSGDEGTNGKENTPDQDAAIQLAKEAKRKGGLTADEAAALLEQAREAGLPVRGPESHPDRPHKGTHIHIGPIGHIPVR